jgi:hypothetical protein
MIQYGVAVLVKDKPFTAACALSWIIWVALNSSNLPCWTTSGLTEQAAVPGEYPFTLIAGR